MNVMIRVLVAAFAVVMTPVVLVLAVIDYGHSAWGFAFLGFLLVGAVILWRRPQNAIGWLLFIVGAGFDTVAVEQWYVRSGAGPGPVAAELLFLPLSSLPWMALILLVVLFPEGHSTTRLQSMLVYVVVVVGAVGLLATLTQPDALTSRRPNPLAVSWIAPAASWLIGGPGSFIIPGVLLVALVSLIRRWHDSSGERRLQFRWLIWGGGLTMLALPVLFLYSGAVWSLIGVSLLVSLWAIPTAIGVAVTRYRLYDIDRIISRTAAYAIVTVLLALTYAAIVTSVTHIVGTQSSLVVASATLAVAALFRPLLSRVQQIVDRRFNRERVDAQRELHRFATLLIDDVHPDRARDEFIAVARRTLAPATVALWMVQHSSDE